MNGINKIKADNHALATLKTHLSFTEGKNKKITQFFHKIPSYLVKTKKPKINKHFFSILGQVSAQLHPYYKDIVAQHIHWIKTTIEDKIKSNLYNMSKYQQLVDSVRINPA